MPKLRMALAEDQLSLAREDHALHFSPVEEEVLELEELKTCFLKFYEDQIPDFFLHVLARKGSSCLVRNQYPDNLFEVNFRNSVGLTRIGPLRVRVKSLKITENQYHSILDYISGKYANLVFSFDVPLGQSYGKGKPGPDVAYVEYLFLKKYLLDDSPGIDGIAALIIANPHMKLQSEYPVSPLEEVSDITPGILFKTLSMAGSYGILRPGHPLLETGLGKTIHRKTGRRIYPSQAFKEYRYHTLDTGENRFVQHFLKRVEHRMDGLAEALKNTAGGYLNPDIEDNINLISRKIGRFLNDPIWRDVGEMSFIPANSQVLHRRDGYRQLFSLYSLLQLSTQAVFDEADFKNLLETKDLPTLFEYWSFFLVKEVLDRRLKIHSCRSIVWEDPKELKVSVGVSVEYEQGTRLWFNKHCSRSEGYQPDDFFPSRGMSGESYSHGLSPDIMISKGNRLLIFDAKYKGKGRNGGFYGEDEQGTVYLWKEEDIDKMHTYREAIRNVTGAFILYPGENPVIFPAHGSEKLFEGVGALPLQPADHALPVQKHLADIERIIDDFIKSA